MAPQQLVWNSRFGKIDKKQVSNLPSASIKVVDYSCVHKAYMEARSSKETRVIPCRALCKGDSKLEPKQGCVATSDWIMASATRRSNIQCSPPAVFPTELGHSELTTNWFWIYWLKQQALGASLRAHIKHTLVHRTCQNLCEAQRKMTSLDNLDPELQ